MAADPLTSRTVDDLLVEGDGFDFDDDPFADKPPRNTERDDKTTLSPRKRKADDDNPFGGNDDEEIKITKQRKKIPKLDAERLLSEPGIPKMRKLLRSGDLKKKLRLKGKGHEFSDAARLLNYYQLWLDQLYPRAKFADALQLVEKAGHTKKLQMYRKSWIDESKPGYIRREDIEQAVDDEDAARGEESSVPAQGKAIDSPDPEKEEDPAAMFFGDGSVDDEPNAGGPDDDELDALLAQDEGAPSKSTNKAVLQDDSEGEDDLDALLAADQGTRRQDPAPVVEDEDELGALMEQHNATTNKPRQEVEHQVQEDPEDDELDAILNEDSQSKPVKTNDVVPDDTFDDFDDDADDLDALLAGQQAAPEPELPTMGDGTGSTEFRSQGRDEVLPGSEEVPELDNVVSSSPIPNVRTDELDGLMDEHDATVEKHKARDSELVEEFLSSSPIPNRDSQ